MNKEQLIGNWNQIKGKVKEQFGKLTDDDLVQISGKRDQFVGAIQKKYGCSKEEAESKLANFESKFSDFKEQLIGNWNQIRGKVKEQFGKLTDDDLARIEGKRDQLIGAIQKKYGCSKEQAETNLRNFESRLAKIVGYEKEEFDVPRKTGTEG